MRRREFITLFGGAAAWPLAGRAQQATVPVIGYFSARSFDAEAALRVPFLEALEQAGFAPRRNVVIEYRFAQGRMNVCRRLRPSSFVGRWQCWSRPGAPRPWPQQGQLQPFPSSSPAGPIRSNSAWWRASTVRAATRQTWPR